MSVSFYKSDSLLVKKFREYFLPSVLASLAGQMGIVVDGLIVGNLIGPKAMTAVSVCMPFEQILSSLSILLSIGAGSMIAVAAGARKKEEADRLFTAVLILNGLVSMIILLCMLPIIGPAAHFLTNQEKIVPLTYSYLQVMIFRVPFRMLTFSSTALMRSDGMAKLTSQGTVLSQVVNIGLDLLLVGGLGAGIYGAAVATVVSDAAGFLYMIIIYFRSQKRTLHLTKNFGGMKNFAVISKDLMVAGVPTAVAMSLVSVRVWCTYHIVDMAAGAEGMQIYAVCSAVLTVMSMIAEGIQAGMIPVVGVLYGEKDYRGIRMLYTYVLKFSLVLTGVLMLPLFIYPNFLLKIYNLAPDLVIEGAWDVRLFCISLFGVLLTFMTVYYYTTIGQTKPANIITVVEGVLVVVPMGWLLARLIGMEGVWAAFILAELSGFAVLFIYIKTAQKKDKELYPDYFMIPKTLQELLYDVSVKAEKDTASRLSDDAVEALKKGGIESSIAVKAGVALEEIIYNLTNRDPGKAPDMDIRILKSGSGVTVSLRDNGSSFNPMEYTADEPDRGYLTDGILVFRALVKDVRYSRVLSLNQTIIDV